jgi:hypothetical protein
MATIQDAKRLIALSPEGLRILGAGVSRPCFAGRFNAAAQAALSDGATDYTAEERRLIAEFIESEEGESRDYMLRVRLSDDERAELARRAAQAGTNMSEYVRRQVLAEPATTECIYCGRTVSGTGEEPTPAVADDDAWAALAPQHEPDCEWITTRAHRINVD